MAFTTDKALFSVAFTCPCRGCNVVSMIFMLNARRHIRIVGIRATLDLENAKGRQEGNNFDREDIKSTPEYA
ncbi:hypothetical protein B0H14DRAFT_3540529 [Mycena olivaceomarginata]|nr:hypothetical protein B0H14DRAFT_3540529 [Mycena olivaceomarginata]